jgi:hypothetical protein
MGGYNTLLTPEDDISKRISATYLAGSRLILQDLSRWLFGNRQELEPVVHTSIHRLSFGVELVRTFVSSFLLFLPISILIVSWSTCQVIKNVHHSTYDKRFFRLSQGSLLLFTVEKENIAISMASSPTSPQFAVPFATVQYLDYNIPLNTFSSFSDLESYNFDNIPLIANHTRLLRHLKSLFNQGHQETPSRCYLPLITPMRTVCARTLATLPRT